MNTSIAKTSFAVLALVFTSHFGFAHTTAVTSPKSGAVLAQSPPAIEIKFAHEASLTAVIVVAAGKPERKLEFAPKGSAKLFTIANANLDVGRNEIQWKALSKDGHVVAGSIILVIDPAAPKTH
jgi:copper resistance protein C